MDAMPRREALRTLGLLGGAALATGCTPLKVVMHWYPAEFDSDEKLVDRVLVAFAEAVVPGSGMSSHTMARPFHDEQFPLHKYVGFLASDLCSRAKACAGTERFELLSRADRALVIEDALSADSTTEKLYCGAIYLTQIAFYAGIYDDASGCTAIEFDGHYRRRPLAERTYLNVHDFLAEEIGVNGNYA